MAISTAEEIFSKYVKPLGRLELEKLIELSNLELSRAGFVASSKSRSTGKIPIQSPPLKRIAGLHEGMVWMSDDFCEPLPDEFWFGDE